MSDPDPKVGAPVGNQNASKVKNNPSDDADCFTPQEARAHENGIHPATQRKLDKIAKVAPGYLPKIAAKEISINKAAVEHSKKLAVSTNPAREAQKGRRVRERDKVATTTISPPRSERARTNGLHPVTQSRLDRIARESPELLSEIQAGTKTIHRAAVELGIVKVKTPLEQVIAAFQRLSSDDNDPASDC